FEQRLVANPVSFRDDAKTQIHTLEIDEELKELAVYLVDTLNDRGLLETPLEDIATDISFKTQKWVEVQQLEAARNVLRSIEPVGLGAKDIRECLLLQLERKAPTCEMAATAHAMIEQHYDDLI